MPLKRKLMPIPDSNLLVIQPLNASGSSTDKTTRSILAASKPFFKP